MKYLNLIKHRYYVFVQIVEELAVWCTPLCEKQKLIQKKNMKRNTLRNIGSIFNHLIKRNSHAETSYQPINMICIWNLHIKRHSSEERCDSIKHKSNRWTNDQKGKKLYKYRIEVLKTKQIDEVLSHYLFTYVIVTRILHHTALFFRECSAYLTTKESPVSLTGWQYWTNPTSMWAQLILN